MGTLLLHLTGSVHKAYHDQQNKPVARWESVVRAPGKQGASDDRDELACLP